MLSVFTVRAGPASGPLRCIGRIRDPAALVRDMESLTFATGITRNLSTVSRATFRVLGAAQDVFLIER
jgi:hypothetical protein